MNEIYIEPDTYTLTVDVVQKGSGLPISGATVKAEGPVTKTTVSDAYGEAILTELESGSYNIIVRHDNYEDTSLIGVIIDTDVKQAMELESLGIEINMMSLVVAIIFGAIIAIIGLIPRIPLGKFTRAGFVVFGLILIGVIYFILEYFEVFI